MSKVLIEVSNSFCYLAPFSVSPTDKARQRKVADYLYNRLIVRVEQSYYVRHKLQLLGLSPGMDTVFRFFNKRDNSFLTGLLPAVEKILKGAGQEYEIADLRIDPLANVRRNFKTTLTSRKGLNTVELRDYQKEALKKIEDGANRGILALATNAGKTYLAAAIVNALGLKTVFLVDRLELCQQAYNVLNEFTRCKVGIVTSDQFRPAEVTVAMQKTLHNLIQKHGMDSEPGRLISRCHLLFADECHKAGSKTWRWLITKAYDAYYRYGLSGTPDTDDKVRNVYLRGLFGPIIYRVSNSDLVEAGYSARPVVNVVSYKSERVSPYFDYALAYEKAITECESRNEAVVKIAESCTGTTLIIVKHIRHGEILKNMLNKSGKFVSGKSDKNYRMQVYSELKSGTSDIITASLIYKEGIDIDTIDNLIYAVGEKAPITILQVLGRGLRKREGKEVLNYYDFLDTNCRYTIKHTNQRIKIYEREKFDVRRIDV